MDLWIILLRTVFVYFFVFFVLRIMGKREIGKLSLFDLVISIMIAEIAVFVIEDVDKSMWDGIVPILTLVAIQMLIAIVLLKSITMRKWFDGKPSIIIRGGKLDREEMRKQRYNLSDLMFQLRHNNVWNIADVEFAILETSGKLTVLKKNDMQPSSKPPSNPASFQMEASAELGENMIQTNTTYRGMPVSLIMDGDIQLDNLNIAGLDEKWLLDRLAEKGIDDASKVFFCSLDYLGHLYLTLK